MIPQPLGAAPDDQTALRRPTFEKNDLVVASSAGDDQFFGDESTLTWDLNALGIPANSNLSWGMIHFDSFRGSWRDYAKEFAMVLLHPTHPALQELGIHLPPEPKNPRTLKMALASLRGLQEVATLTGLPVELSDWTPFDCSSAIAALKGIRGVASNQPQYAVRLLRLLFVCSAAFTHGGLSTDPWPLRRSPLAAQGRGPLKTQPIDPEVYFPLLSAAWSYVSVFSPDILAALEQKSQHQPLSSVLSTDEERSIDELIRAFVADPQSEVPMHRDFRRDREPAIAWRQLSFNLTAGATGIAFQEPHRRPQILRMVEEGRARHGGFIRPTAALPGRLEPWSPGWDTTELSNEKRALRAACYIVVAALTMMRDSEIQELRRGCLTTYYGVSAVKSRLVKDADPDTFRYWWITDPVKRALEVMSEISSHDEKLFSSSRDKLKSGPSVGGFEAGESITRFRDRINATVEQTGLPPIPAGPVRPHMFRRTMALLAEYEHGGQIAAGLQLKHAQGTGVSNSLRASYTAPTEAWAIELGERRARVDARRALDDIAAGGKPTGPGASRLSRIISESSVIEGRTREQLLAAEFPDLRFGTLNLCLGDRAVAKCLPDGEDRGTAEISPSACHPSTCPNSVVMPDNRLAWTLEEDKLISLRRSRRLSPINQARVDRELVVVRKALTGGQA